MAEAEAKFFEYFCLNIFSLLKLRLTGVSSSVVVLVITFSYSYEYMTISVIKSLLATQLNRQSWNNQTGYLPINIGKFSGQVYLL